LIFALQNASWWNNKSWWNNNKRNSGANSRVAFCFERRRTGTKQSSPSSPRSSLPSSRRENPKGKSTMRGGYSDSDVGWFLRAARALPVIAGAALLGGMIGGFAVFAVDSALNWEPAPELRPDARADSDASPVVAQTTKPVRIVGGAIPDPSAGMSAPPPAPQPPAPQQRSAAAPAQSPAQISPQLLMGKPLGPASQLQPQTATAGPTSNAPQNQTAI
jgi:hypothetical protein